MKLNNVNALQAAAKVPACLSPRKIEVKTNYIVALIVLVNSTVKTNVVVKVYEQFCKICFIFRPVYDVH